MMEDEVETAPHAFFCPVGTWIMEDPVILVGSSQTVDRCPLETWLRLGSNRCPVTNVELANVEVVPNKALRSAIEQWRRSKGRRITSAFLCPISNFSMDDPVIIIESAETVSRSAATAWRKSGSFRCPVTGAELKSRNMIENIALRSALAEWLEKDLENAIDCNPASTPLDQPSEDRTAIQSSPPPCTKNLDGNLNKGNEPHTAPTLGSSCRSKQMNIKQSALFSAAACLFGILLAAFSLFSLIAVCDSKPKTIAGNFSHSPSSGSLEESSSEIYEEQHPLSKLEYEFFSAIKLGDTLRAQELVDKGVNTNAKYGWPLYESPLHLAASQCSVDIVKILVQAGAYVEMKTSESSTPLALVTGSCRAMLFLLNNKTAQFAEIYGKEQKQQRARNRVGCLQTLRVLMAAGASVDAQDACGWSPLMYTAYSGNIGAARELIHAGASMSTGTQTDLKHAIVPQQSTALHIAVKYGNVEIVKLLVGSGASTTTKNCLGITPKTQTCLKEDKAQEIHNIMSGLG